MEELSLKMSNELYQYEIGHIGIGLMVFAIGIIRHMLYNLDPKL